MREAHDARRQTFLMTVEFSDFDLGSKLGMGRIDARKRDRFI